MQPAPVEPTPEPVETPPETPPSRLAGLKSVASTLAIFLIVPLTALFIVFFVFQSYQVDGESMENTLQHQDKLIVYKLPKTWASLLRKTYMPKRGEIVVFTQHEETSFGGTAKRQLIKRVIGVPGDHVVIRDKKVTIYNAEHPNGYDPDKGQAYSKFSPTTSNDVDITIKDDEVFVLGDNRNNSQDSRYFGPIKTSTISGTLALRFFPLNKTKSF